MPGTLDSRLAVIRTLIEQAPDSAIRSLDMALSADSADGPMAMIRDLVAAEAGERRTRAMTFAPIVPLCPKTPSLRHDTFPSRAVPMLWKALKVAHAQAFQAAVDAARGGRDDGDATPFDRLAAFAAVGLRAPGTSAFAPIVDMLEAAEAGSTTRLAAYLDLIPLARPALVHMPDWLGRMTEERAASVRLAFRDAVTLDPDAGPRFMDILIGQMKEPWEVLRIVSALMDRPSDDYMAGSELAHIGVRLLDEVDRRIEALGNFDPQGGAAAGTQAAEDARVVVLCLSEFEHSLDIKREGLWGGRIVRQKRQLAQIVELRLAKVDEIVDHAMPIKPVRMAGRMMRGVPKLTEDPNPAFIAKAEGALTFLDGAHLSAATGGYTALRNKVLEKLQDRLEQYAEDLIDELRNADSELHQRARLYLDLCARFVGLVQGEKAAQIVRRRAAA